MNPLPEKKSSSALAAYSYLRPRQQKSSTSDRPLTSSLSALRTASLPRGTLPGGETPANGVTRSPPQPPRRLSVFTCLSGCSQRLLNVTCRFPAAGGLSKAKSRTGLSLCHPEGGRSKVSQSVPLWVSSETAAGEGRDECVCDGENTASKYSTVESFTCGWMQNPGPVAPAGFLKKLQ